MARGAVQDGSNSASGPAPHAQRSPSAAVG